MLVEMQGLVGSMANEAGISKEEKEANQIQIDSILQTIDRIANSTSFQGIKLLNGNFDYTLSNDDSSVLGDVQINSAKLSDAAGSNIRVDVTLVDSASTGTVYLLDNGGTLSAGGDGQVTFEVTGNDGTQQFTFASGTANSAVVAAINTFSDAIGVTASLSGASDEIRLDSSSYGSDQFVRVKQLSENGGNSYVSSSGNGAAVSEFKGSGLNANVNINGMQATSDVRQATSD